MRVMKVWLAQLPLTICKHLVPYPLQGVPVHGFAHFESNAVLPTLSLHEIWYAYMRWAKFQHILCQ